MVATGNVEPATQSQTGFWGAFVAALLLCVLCTIGVFLIAVGATASGWSHFNIWALPGCGILLLWLVIACKRAASRAAWRKVWGLLAGTALGVVLLASFATYVLVVRGR